MFSGMLAAASPLRAGGGGAPSPGASPPAGAGVSSPSAAAPAGGRGTSSRTGPDATAAAAAAALAAAEEADKTARALEQSTAQALSEALGKTEEGARTAGKPAAGTAGAGASGGRAEPAAGGRDAARRGAEEAEPKAFMAKWEAERLRVIHSMAKSTAAAAAADLQFARVRYAAAAGPAVSGRERDKDREGDGMRPAAGGAAPSAAEGQQEREPQAPVLSGNGESPILYSPPRPPLTLGETALICFGMCLLGSAGSALVFWILQRKALREGGWKMEDGFSDLKKDLVSLERRTAAAAAAAALPPHQSPLHALRHDTRPPAAPALPPHAVLAMSRTVSLEEGGWLKICQDSLRILERIHSGRAMVNELPGELKGFPSHQQAARKMLLRSRAQPAGGPGPGVWTVRMRDALASGLLHDPELPEFSGGGEDPEHHFRRRFIRDVLSPEISPLLIVMEEMRHLNDFLPRAQGPDLSGRAQRLKEAMEELLRLCRDDFGFEIEYVPLLDVCDFRTLKNTRNGDPARLPDYYNELNCDNKAVRGILRYGNQSTGLTPDSPTEIVYSP